jgi:hypothetical protein
MPALAILIVLAALIGLSVVTGDWSDEAPAAQARPAPVSVIAHRVEDLRHLRFRSLPRPLSVTPAQSRREGLEAIDRDYPAERRRADEEILRRLGLVEPGFSLREFAGSVFGEGVGGYYDPKDGRLRIVSGTATGTRVLAEIVIAHELTHALEDQRFDIDLIERSDDPALAYSALVEGSATEVMFAYAREHFRPSEALAGVLGSAFEPGPAMPAFLEAQLVFPYVDGQAFIGELLRRAGGRWDLVDLALRARPPASTEQVLHPDAYFDADEPRRVRLRLRLGDGWRRAARGTWGELQTRELLGSAEAAEGWGGDRYELWTRGGESVLVMRWMWDTRRDEAEFAARLREWDFPGARAVARRGGAVTLAVADDAALARRAVSSPAP